MSQFATQASGQIQLRVERGEPILKDRAAFAAAVLSPDTLAAIQAVVLAALNGNVPEAPQATYLYSQEGQEPNPTRGQWGSR